MKEEIEKYLQEQGFVLQDVAYKKLVQVKTGSVVVNGVQRDQMSNTMIEVQYFDTGWESDANETEESKKPLTGWMITINGFKVQYLVHDLEEFKQIFSGKF